jgi:hypothetical protein
MDKNSQSIRTLFYDVVRPMLGRLCSFGAFYSKDVTAVSVTPAHVLRRKLLRKFGVAQMPHNVHTLLQIYQIPAFESAAGHLSTSLGCEPIYSKKIPPQSAWSDAASKLRKEVTKDAEPSLLRCVRSSHSEMPATGRDGLLILSFPLLTDPFRRAFRSDS